MTSAGWFLSIFLFRLASHDPLFFKTFFDQSSLFRFSRDTLLAAPVSLLFRG